MEKIVRKIKEFMYGRYGTDQLSLVLVIAGIVSYVLYFITRFFPLYWLSLAFYAYDIFRVLSKNIPKRQLENQKWLQFTWKVRTADIPGKIRAWWRNIESKAEETRKYSKFRCPSCGQKMRVPRGRGKISVTCPKCGTNFIKKV